MAICLAEGDEMKIMMAYLSSLVLVCFVNSHALPPAAANYSLAWSDEFDGTSLDTVNNWSYDTIQVSNSITQSYTRSCVTVEDGKLVIWSRYNPNLPNYLGYTSGRIDTHDKKIFTYGYFEASIKAPLGQVSGPGLWSAVWLLGNSIQHGVAWPTCGEMELYEQRPSNAVIQPNMPQPVPATIGDDEFIACCHYGVNGAPSYHSCQHDYPTALSDRFHTYGLLWDSTHVEYYFDDTLFWGVDCPIVNDTNFGVPSITQAANYTAFHSPFFLIINVAIGGAYQGQNIDNTIFPTKMELDYVRVYQQGAARVIAKDAGKRKNILMVANPFTARLTVYDLTGKLVADLSSRLKSMRPGSNVTQAIPSGLPHGIYLLKLFDNGKCFPFSLAVH